mmetsp:Transcript_34489/g.82740  ORF Transcript_34489/g.82740 Transcript_34489/m.82740 type:complete len:201 (+) Transcript_34489:53-655(+)
MEATTAGGLSYGLVWEQPRLDALAQRGCLAAVSMASSSARFTRVISDSWPSSMRPPLLISFASMARFAISSSSTFRACSRRNSIRALHCASSCLASSWTSITCWRSSGHRGQLLATMSSTPPVYPEAGSPACRCVCSSGRKIGGMLVCTAATSEVKRLISVRSQERWDRRILQKGQSSYSNLSACANAQGGRTSSLAVSK